MQLQHATQPVGQTPAEIPCSDVQLIFIDLRETARKVWRDLHTTSQRWARHEMSHLPSWSDISFMNTVDSRCQAGWNISNNLWIYVKYHWETSIKGRQNFKVLAFRFATFFFWQAAAAEGFLFVGADKVKFTSQWVRTTVELLTRNCDIWCRKVYKHKNVLKFWRKKGKSIFVVSSLISYMLSRSELIS